MKYKLVATDLDGTFLDGNGNISKRNMEAINRIREKGCIFTVITGRMYSSAKQYIDELQCRELAEFYQGAVITDTSDGNVIYRTTMKKSVCESVYSDAVKRSLNIQAYADDKVYAEIYDENTAFYEHMCRLRVNIVDSIEYIISSNDNVKLLINSDRGSVKRNIGFFMDKYSKETNVTQSGEHFIEFTHKDANKGHALELIAHRYGIDRSEIIAFGDHMNDISMLQYAGTGVAMGNAPQNVKKYADIVAPPNTESGVAAVLEKLCLTDDI